MTDLIAMTLEVGGRSLFLRGLFLRRSVGFYVHDRRLLASHLARSSAVGCVIMRACWISSSSASWFTMYKSCYDRLLYSQSEKDFIARLPGLCRLLEASLDSSNTVPWKRVCTGLFINSLVGTRNEKLCAARLRGIFSIFGLYCSG